MKKITLICSDRAHPIFPILQAWVKSVNSKYDINLINSTDEINWNGDLLFLVSCTEVVKKNIRDKFTNTLVLHASDLPKGRGWSPHIWSVLNNEESIVLSLLEAESSVDTGKIWKKLIIKLDGSELFNEINEKLFLAELQLIEWACDNLHLASATEQIGVPSYYEKRSAKDSELNLDLTLREQINLLRVSDYNRFPAYFMHKGHKYILKLEKADK